MRITKWSTRSKCKTWRRRTASDRLKLNWKKKKKSKELQFPSTSEKHYDAEIRRLSVELTKTQMGKVDAECDFMEKLGRLEREPETLESEAREELDAKKEGIADMTERLASKEDELDRFEEEKIKLLFGMTSDKCNPVELSDFQRESLDLTTKAKRKHVQLSSSSQPSKVAMHARKSVLNNSKTKSTNWLAVNSTWMLRTNNYERAFDN